MDSKPDPGKGDNPNTPVHWYSWDSPVGLGLFIALLAVAIAVVVLAFR